MSMTLNIVLTVVLLITVFTDLRSSRIPNAVTFPVMSFALAAHLWMGGSRGLLFSLAGLSMGLGLFLILYVSRCIGAGDVKLMAAVGAIVGPYGALISSVLAVLVGGVYALGAMCYQWGIRETGRKLAVATLNVFLMRNKSCGHGLQLPFQLRYGLAIAGGTLLFLLGVHPFGG